MHAAYALGVEQPKGRDGAVDLTLRDHFVRNNAEFVDAVRGNSGQIPITTILFRRNTPATPPHLPHAGPGRVLPCAD